MQFIIDGVTYEAASIERVTGRLALDLPKQTGLGVQTLARRLEEMSRLGYDESGAVIVLPAGAAGSDGSAVMDSEPHLRALLAFLWLSRRMAGESLLTFDDACDFPFTSLEIVNDDEDEDGEPEVDPTSPPASDPQEPGEPEA
jgi:hypothetical protein